MKKQKQILVAPLSWGLGHATRCIPIIHALQQRNITVWLGSDGPALKLLRQEFPQLPYLELPSYAITYPNSNMIRNIAPQVPKILNAIRLERKMIQDSIKKHKIDALISDNRYGVADASIPSVFITHQLRILMPYKWLEAVILKLNNFFIRKFDQIWIPDYPTPHSIAGKLIQNEQLTKKSHYLGALSRFKLQTLTPAAQHLIILSGPEPQRSYFEQQLIEQAIPLKQHNFLIVRGKLEGPPLRQPASHIQIVEFMNSIQLQEAICKSLSIICRSGYSSIMDLAFMQYPNALMVPTPGQTEQEYLAQHLDEQNIYPFQTQKMLDLKSFLEQPYKHKGFEELPKESYLDNTLDKWLNNF